MPLKKTRPSLNRRSSSVNINPSCLHPLQQLHVVTTPNLTPLQQKIGNSPKNLALLGKPFFFYTMPLDFFREPLLACWPKHYSMQNKQT